MATTISKAIQPSNSTDAMFREWSKYIFDGMVAGGWVQTADTGQINFATVTRPLAINTAMGYVILRMDDTLQSTVPIYVRLDFGSSSGAANTPAVWITVGGGSSGAGVITPVYFSSPTSSPATAMSGTNGTGQTGIYSWLGADTNRAQVALFNNAAGTFNLVFSIERSKNASGGDSSTGVLLLYSTSGSQLNRSQVVLASGEPNPPAETAIPVVISGRNPSARTENIGVSVAFMFNGTVIQPGYSFLLGMASDIAAGARVEVLVYGTVVVYQQLLGFRLLGAGGGASGSWQLLMRYE